MTPAPGGDGGTERVEEEQRDVQVDDAVEPDDAIEPEHAPDGDEEAPVSVSAPDEDEPRAAGRWGRWAALGAAVLLVGAYVVAAFYASSRIPDGTHVLGVDLGGLSRSAAIAALEPAVDEAEATPVTLTVEDRAGAIDPGEAGLSADAEATVDALLSFSLNPVQVMRAFSGSDVDLDPVTQVDRDALVAAIDETSADLAAGAVDASVTVSSTGAAVTPGSDGVGIDVEATADLVAAEWPVDSVEAPSAPVEPAITTAAAEDFAAELNATTLAADVLMAGENGDATVTSEQMVDNATVVAEDDALMLEIDGGPIAAELERANPDLVSEPSGASFSFDAKHQLKVVDSKPGRAIDPDALGAAVVAAATSADRTGTLPYHDTEAPITNENSGIGDLTEMVASFDTPLTPEPIRTKNLVRGAQKVTGTLLKPGEQMSLLDVLSPITEAGGYYPAHVIVDGYLADGIGGGLSQMATTTYNAAYFAGLQIDEHRPHSKYFSRYPAGREATLYIGSIDLKVTNDTPYALVFSSYVEDDRLHVEIWSTPYFTVKTYASERSNVRAATTVESDHEGCINTPKGEPGFTITNRREVYLDGELQDESSYTWTYKPNDGVKCV